MGFGDYGCLRLKKRVGLLWNLTDAWRPAINILSVDKINRGSTKGEKLKP